MTLALVGGCEEQHAPSPTDAQTQLSSPQEKATEDDAPPPCAELELTAAPTSPRLREGPAPEPGGGRILDGVYDSADFDVYGKEAVKLIRPFRQTIRFEDNGTGLVMTRLAYDGARETLRFRVKVEGPSIVLSGSCPSRVEHREVTMQFTTSENEFLAHDKSPSGSETLTRYVRREPSSAESKQL